MPLPWIGEEIHKCFGGVIDAVNSDLRNKLIIASNPHASSRSDILDILHELDKCKVFVTECRDIENQICRNGATPRSMGLYKVQDSAGPILNFYEYNNSSWIAYFHIDYQFNIFTSVLAHRDTDPRPDPLRKELVLLIEDFRAKP